MNTGVYRAVAHEYWGLQTVICDCIVSSLLYAIIYIQDI